MRSAIFLAVLCALLSFSLVASADTRLQGNAAGVVGGYNTDAEAPLLGVEGRFTFYVAPNVPLTVNPGFNYFFLGRSTFLGAEMRSQLMQFDLNLLYNLDLGAIATPYAGIGASLFYSGFEVVDSQGRTISSDSDTNVGLSIVGGTTVDLAGALGLFAQLRLSFVDESNSFSVMAGLTYRF